MNISLVHTVISLGAYITFSQFSPSLSLSPSILSFSLPPSLLLCLTPALGAVQSGPAAEAGVLQADPSGFLLRGGCGLGHVPAGPSTPLHPGIFSHHHHVSCCYGVVSTCGLVASV